MAKSTLTVRPQVQPPTIARWPVSGADAKNAIYTTPLAGGYLIDLDRHAMARHVRSRILRPGIRCPGPRDVFVQANISSNVSAGTVRGLHFQREPHAEVKLVRCINGSIYDVIVDMREGSATISLVRRRLSQDNGLAMYVPKGFAHGYQALTDGATVFYMVSTFYAPEAEGGLRFDDPRLAIRWPRAVTELRTKDANGRSSAADPPYWGNRLCRPAGAARTYRTELPRARRCHAKASGASSPPSPRSRALSPARTSVLKAPPGGRTPAAASTR